MQKKQRLVCPEKKTLAKKASIKKAITPQKTPKKQTPYTRVFVAGGSRSGLNPVYKQQAFELGKEICRQNYQLTFGLSSRGIMGAVAKGVMSEWVKKEKRIPVPIQGITTAHYKKLYPSDNVDGVKDIIISNTLEQRKANLLNSDFIVFVPGGVGTLDELSYNCIAIQDGFLDLKPFVLFNIDGFFHHLLEYLKDIHLKGFSDFIPFIVADNIFETRIAFEMIAHYCGKKKQSKHQIVNAVNKIVYDFPYVIEQQKQHPEISIATLLKNKDAILRGSQTKAKQKLEKEIETAYLNKEIARMYDRLAKAGRDTALVSHKLDQLKAREEMGRNNGFY
ncbi:MAG: LOG family protein [Alphaproteobacteria bacterium]|nr:LOG family protein [Alphaproteobacteria bacterium]